MSGVLVISGPVGSGKTDVAQTVCGKLPGQAGVVRTDTTRAMRRVEAESGYSDHYHISPQNFSNKLAGGEYIEHEKVGAEYYGLTKSALLKRLNLGTAVVVLTPDGAEKVAAFCKSISVPCVKAFIDADITRSKHSVMNRFHAELREVAGKANFEKSKQDLVDAAVERVRMIRDQRSWTDGNFDIRLDNNASATIESLSDDLAAAFSGAVASLRHESEPKLSGHSLGQPGI